MDCGTGEVTREDLHDGVGEGADDRQEQHPATDFGVEPPLGDCPQMVRPRVEVLLGVVQHCRKCILRHVVEGRANPLPGLV